MKLLWSYLEKFGRPLAFYTDKASLFQTAEKRKRDEPGVEKDPVEMPPTQIGRALQELGITWIAAHSPQAKGRVERNFGTAQDRLVKGMRVAGVKTIEEANEYLENEYLAWWERELTVEAANADDAHRPLEKSHDLAASSAMWRRARCGRLHLALGWQVVSDRTPGDHDRTTAEPTCGWSRRLDGSLAVRLRERYLPVKECAVAAKPKPPRLPKPAEERRVPAGAGQRLEQEFRFEEGAEGLAGGAASPGHRREEAVDDPSRRRSGAKAKFALYRETLRTTGW